MALAYVASNIDVGYISHVLAFDD